MFESDETLLNKAKTDILNERYSSAEKKLLKLINKKYKDAYYVLGDLYEHQNKASQAVKYYQFAANDGNIDAMIKVGDLCSDKGNSNYNSQKALLYYEMGADNDNAYCLYQLGIMSANFEGKIHHYNEAISYLEKAIAIDASYTSDIAYYLGKCYLEEDLDSAMSWYEEAYHAGNMNGAYELVSLYEEQNEIDKVKQIYRDIIIATNDIETKFKLAQLLQSDNKQDALSYYHQIISELESLSSMNDKQTNIYLTSLYGLGNLYYANNPLNPAYAMSITYGDTNTNSDNSKAISFYELAAKLNHKESINKLTQLYQLGQYDDKLHLLKPKQVEKPKVKHYQNNPEGEKLYQTGMLYYDKEDYQTAIDYFQKAADKGNIDAYNKLGYCFKFGKFVTKDYTKAFEWFEKSADLGNTYGMYQLALLYDFGNGVKQDEQKAAQLYLQAYQQLNDHDLDDYNLGILYNNLGNDFRKGIGIQKDYKMAFELLNKAIEYDKEYAPRNLGHMYYYGQGVSIDYLKAFQLYEQSANAGNEYAMDDLGYYYKHGTHVNQNYQKAYEWFKKSADANDNYGMYQLGLMYYYGQGVEINYSKAMAFYESAAEGGNISAMNDLGFYYKTGTHVTQDDGKAFFWFQKSANENDAYGLFQLGQMYNFGRAVVEDKTKANECYNKAIQIIETTNETIGGNNNLGILYANLGNNYRLGKGITKDYQKAFDLLSKAVEYGNAFGMRALGLMYFNGQGLTVSYLKAFDLYEQAAKGGNIPAMQDLGFYYKTGKHVEKDYQKALYWFNQGVAKNDVYSMFQLGTMYEFGFGVTIDYVKSNEWYLKAVERVEKDNSLLKNSVNRSTLYNNLANNYRRGRGIQQSYQKAFELLSKVESYENKYVMYNLGLMYKNGEYVSQDYNKARYYFDKSANKGHQSAKKELEKLSV
ncbi:MAG: hypothetical protein LUG46_01565 [Erysipelotrichaceae bacterium]|nr:hypothetical protein [Erysipelotrichaceae bacterium]